MKGAAMVKGRSRRTCSLQCNKTQCSGSAGASCGKSRTLYARRGRHAQPARVSQRSAAATVA